MRATWVRRTSALATSLVLVSSIGCAADEAVMPLPPPAQAQAAVMPSAASTATVVPTSAPKPMMAPAELPANAAPVPAAEPSAPPMNAGQAGAGMTPTTAPMDPSAAAGNGAPAADPGFPDKDYYNPAVPCEKGKLKGSEIIIMGESFYALSGEIQRDLEGLAKAAGSPSPYRGFAVSGTTLGNNQIPSQFDRALMGGDVKLVIMDGGGNDQYNRYCEECPGIVEKLFAHMAESGVEDVLYTCYPDPGNPIGSAPFKQYHDMLRLTIREVCVATSVVRCHFLDLRPFWKDGDTNDGLHPTASGAKHVSEAIWAFMQKDCIGQ